MKNSLVIGSNGRLGSSLVKQLSTYNISYDKIIRSDANFESKDESLSYFSNHKYENIFIAAANTNVYKCELDESTRSTNVDLVKNVVDCSKDSNIIFYSSDYVFDGEKGKYHEDDIPNPINKYGKQKLEAEKYIQKNCGNYKIIRTNAIYGKDKNTNLANMDFITRVISTIRSGKKYSGVVDEYITPTFVGDIAAYSLWLLNNSESGIFHAAGPDYVSRYEFASNVIRLLDLDDNLLIPIFNDSLDRKTPRPANGGLVSIKNEYQFCSYKIIFNLHQINQLNEYTVIDSSIF